MIFDSFDYIKLPPKTGDLHTDVKNLLIVNGREYTYAHVCRVAEINRKIAGMYFLDDSKCCSAGILHDVSTVIKPQDMLEYAVSKGWQLCEAEKKFPILLHQRLSVNAAREYFGIIDCDILAAVDCHTTLRVNAGSYEKALFIADKLAWDKQGTPPFYDKVIEALDNSLDAAAFEYMRFMTENDMILCPHENWTAAYEWLNT